jgi:hypothetical protein
MVIGAAIAITLSGAQAQTRVPEVVEVPTGPAFVRLPGRKEIKATKGLDLLPSTQLRTSKPGRMQVMLGNGRQFRMGGDALLRLSGNSVELLKGSVIGWIRPTAKNRLPFEIRTRLATASIQGTTVFIELNDDTFKVFSWEGRVQVKTRSGEEFTLESGQQLLLDLKRQLSAVKGQLDALDAALGESGGMFTPDEWDERTKEPETDDDKNIQWDPPARLGESEVQQRLTRSALINGFSTPLETLPEIEKELGATAPRATP